MRKRRIFFLLAITFHFAIVLVVCIQSSMDGYLSFYRMEPKGVAKRIFNASNVFSKMDGIKQYAGMAGIDAGYGFFAPNVASGYVLGFASYDREGKFLKRQILPDFENRESHVRYSSLLDAFQDKFAAITEQSDTSSFRQRHLNVIVKSIAKWLLEKNANLGSVEATLYLYHFPSLSAYQRGEMQPWLIHIEQFDVLR